MIRLVTLTGNGSVDDSEGDWIGYSSKKLSGLLVIAPKGNGSVDDSGNNSEGDWFGH